MSSLLEEAIVDAKALKEAALKNAESAVLEKYSAEVRGALSTLLEQDELGLGLEEEEAPEADTTFSEDVPYAFQNEELGAPHEDELVEIDFNQLKTRIAEEEAEGEEAAAPELSDALGMADTLQEDGYITPTDLKDDAEEDAASLAGPDDREELQEDEDIALTEEMLADLIEELVVDMVPRPQGWSSEGSAYNSIEQANDEAMLAALEAHPEGVEDEDELTRTAPDVCSDDELFENKYTKLKESTKELHVLLTESKHQLMQLNLDNAKLVYQNKALNSASLNERQKTKIVEAVQSANSVEEANIIFETIQNAVGLPRPSNAGRPQTLREAVQRPTSLLLSSKKNNEATKDPAMGRMLRLAGLNK
tara:strand:+ start:1 stop:1092 length:1092 start_codon:yes stop_codon:yes gene_type:complete